VITLSGFYCIRTFRKPFEKFIEIKTLTLIEDEERPPPAPDEEDDDPDPCIF